MQLQCVSMSPSPVTLTHAVGDMSLNDSASSPPPTYEDSVAASPKPPPQKAMKPFRVGMRLEAVDRKFPYFVCAAQVEAVKLQEGNGFHKYSEPVVCSLSIVRSLDNLWSGCTCIPHCIESCDYGSGIACFNAL